MKESSSPSPSPSGTERSVTLRDEREGEDWSRLWAYLDERGCLHINGQDFGPGTAMVSPDGEYEYFETYAAEVIPRIVEVLDGEPGEPVIEVLRRWSGNRSREMQSRLERAHIPYRLATF